MNWYPWYGQSKEEICIDRRHYWKVNWVVHERHKFTISVEFSLILRSALYDIIKVKISNSKIFCTVGTKNANWQPQVSTIGVVLVFLNTIMKKGVISWTRLQQEMRRVQYQNFNTKEQSKQWLQDDNPSRLVKFKRFLTKTYGYCVLGPVKCFVNWIQWKWKSCLQHHTVTPRTAMTTTNHVQLQSTIQKKTRGMLSLSIILLHNNYLPL